MKAINLGECNGQIYKVLSGVDLGSAARAHYKLDDLDKDPTDVQVIIPEYVYSVNSSYFSGLFQRSLLSMGEEKFRQKYIFECDSIIRKNVEDGIFYIINTKDISKELLTGQ